MSRLVMTMGVGVERLPADIALALIPSLPRAHLERLVQQLIDRMDDTDGDSDREPEETDHGGGEDDCSQTFHDGPGCPISDPDGGQQEDCEDNGDAERAWQPPHLAVLS